MMEDKREIIKDFLKCILTEREMRESGIALARANSAIVELENKKKKFNDQIKAETSVVEADISKLSMVLQNGYEYRDVECEVDRDYEVKKIFTTRLDTGEIIKSRDMTQEELQVQLFNKEREAA